jgi:hypothetical protein
VITQTFLKYLSDFEIYLANFGYFKVKESSSTSENYKEHLSVKYNNNKIQRTVYFDCALFEGTGSTLLSMNMCKIPENNTHFSIFRFLDNHNLNHKITVELHSGGAFEPFVKKYFEDLKLLFENELNDQITGKTFENHIDALKKSMDEY